MIKKVTVTNEVKNFASGNFEQTFKVFLYYQH